MEEVMVKLEVKLDLEMNEIVLYVLKLLCKRNFWIVILVFIKDLYFMEKWVEVLLREMVIRIEIDIYVYCLLWMLFGFFFFIYDLIRYVVIMVKLVIVIDVFGVV